MLSAFHCKLSSKPALFTRKMSNVAFQDGINNFAFDLYGVIEKNGNEFLSPFSITSALLLLMLGTNGTTKNQMMSSIFKDETLTYVDTGYKELSDKLQISAKTNNGVLLSVANRLFGSNTASILNSYRTSALEKYGSELELLDFATKTEQSRLRINSWIASETNDKIKDMLPRGSVQSGTVLVLVNAIYFKGTWKTPFNPRRTRKRNFHVSSTVQKQVAMMTSTHKVESGEYLKLNCKVLKLPYADENLSMIFVVPNDMDGLIQLESKLTFTTFQDILASLRVQKTIINIPRFSFEAKYKLKPTLATLGMTEIMDPVVADFSRMVAAPSRMFVSEALHNAFIDVNEEGSEAAAATTILTLGSSPTLPFMITADHPFLFFILNNESRTILFMGRYVNP